MLYSGAYSIITLYSVTSIVVSILFMLIFQNGIRILVSIQIALMAIIAILLILILMTIYKAQILVNKIRLCSI
jgi:hypothetical protein